MSEKLKLPKLLVENLPLFINTAAETLESFTGISAKKVTHGIMPFRTDIPNNFIYAIMRFKQDLQGHFILAFPRSVASKTMEGLLGEAVSEENIEELKDGVGEFCNIITGSCKTNLQKKRISINFFLPQTYDYPDGVLIVVGDTPGLWIELEFDGSPVFIFLSY